MALQDGYLFHLVARLGLSKDVPALTSGEVGFATDTQTVFFGNDTADPSKIATTKSTESFDFSANAKWVAPGGVVFDRTRTGQVDGVTLKNLNQTNGLLARRGDNSFGAVALRSTDNSLLVDNGSGSQATINLRINPDSDIIQQMFNGLGILNISSISGLQAALDDLLAQIINARDAAINTIRDGVPADYNTLKKLYNYVSGNVIIIGDPSDVASQVINIIRGGVGPARDTLKKISDDLDGIDTRLTAAEVVLDQLGIGNSYYDSYFISIADNFANTHRIQLEIIDRANAAAGLYAPDAVVPH